MPETDDPPFPAAGMGRIVADLSSVITELRVEGEVTAVVQVNAKGEATGVRLVQYPSVEVAKVVAFILMKTSYRPASCGGTPCALEFPFSFNLELR
jgi:hypothetical protein